MKIQFSLIIAVICFVALSSCESSNNDQTNEYCTDAGILLDGGLYYSNYQNCLEGDYPQKEHLLVVLNKYISNTEKMDAFTDAVCQTFPAETQFECYSGVFAIPNELSGFKNILESHSADRSDLCYMAQETGGFIVFYMHNYSQSLCGATD